MPFNLQQTTAVDAIRELTDRERREVFREFGAGIESPGWKLLHIIIVLAFAAGWSWMFASSFDKTEGYMLLGFGLTVIMYAFGGGKALRSAAGVIGSIASVVNGKRAG